jgi:hypothetical protein
MAGVKILFGVALGSLEHYSLCLGLSRVDYNSLICFLIDFVNILMYVLLVLLIQSHYCFCMFDIPILNGMTSADSGGQGLFLSLAYPV